jgi:hypothetical protein
MPEAKQAELTQSSMSWAGPVNCVDDQVVAVDRCRDRCLAVEPFFQNLESHRGVEETETLGSQLCLWSAYVALSVEDLAIEVADLDRVEVDQKHLADPAAGQRQRRPAAQPTHSKNGDPRFTQFALAFGGGLLGRNVAEIAQMAVERDDRREAIIALTQLADECDFNLNPEAEGRGSWKAPASP